MMEPWINLAILPPPVHTVQEEIGKLDTKGLKHACNTIVKVLSKQSPLHKESAILSRFLYKYDKKFRNDIGYRSIRKCNSALRKYLQLNLLKDIENFVNVLPSDGDNYMPTRQMLEYVLVRVITFSKLMFRTCVCSKQGGVFYLNRVKRGDSHWMSLMPYALLSRLWSMCKVLLQHSASWYSNLYQYLDKLVPKGLNFMPENCKLPSNLREFLNLDNLDSVGRLDWSIKKQVSFDLPFEDETDTLDDILNFVSKINDDEEENMLTNKIEQELEFSLDIKVPVMPKVDKGEAISRETFNILNNFQKKLNTDTTPHYFGRVNNLKTLNEFLEKEETYRMNSEQQALTSHLSFMQWQTLKSSLLRVCNDLSRNRKIEKKMQKVWKEKCLDYII